MMHFQFHPEAAEEYKASVLFYEQRRPAWEYAS
jgi:hypothetical protein